jgi:hypothetical protein
MTNRFPAREPLSEPSTIIFSSISPRVDAFTTCPATFDRHVSRGPRPGNNRFRRGNTLTNSFRTHRQHRFINLSELDIGGFHKNRGYVDSAAPRVGVPDEVGATR